VPRHCFSPEQANRTLPLVRRIVSDLLQRGRELRQLAAAGPDEIRQARIAQLQAELAQLSTELERIGCSYKDWGFEMGLVDFPARIDGREVLLCWRSDEPRVAWYHAPDAGFAGRHPIPPELLGAEGEGA